MEFHTTLIIALDGINSKQFELSPVDVVDAEVPDGRVAELAIGVESVSDIEIVWPPVEIELVLWVTVGESTNTAPAKPSATTIAMVTPTAICALNSDMLQSHAEYPRAVFLALCFEFVVLTFELAGLYYGLASCKLGNLAPGRKGKRSS